MPVDLSKDIDECSTLILIISLQKEMNGRSHWLSVRCHSKSCIAKNCLGCVKIEAIRALDDPTGWLDKEHSRLLFHMKIFRIPPITPLPLIILRREKICQQYSPIDFYSHPSNFTAGYFCDDVFSPLFGDAFLPPLSPNTECFLIENKLRFFMAYGKLPWLLLLLYPLCELNMYSVAHCLQCYCRVTYGTNSIRIKLPLDNPFDCMLPKLCCDINWCCINRRPQLLFAANVQAMLTRSKGKPVAYAIISHL